MPIHKNSSIPKIVKKLLFHSICHFSWKTKNKIIEFLKTLQVMHKEKILLYAFAIIITQIQNSLK